MYSTIHSGAIHGIEAVSVHVEVDTSQGLPGFQMVGYLSGEVREAGERVRVALKNSGIPIPPSHITVNLSPADIRKEGTAFDLPIAVGILKSLGHIPEESAENMMIVGELSLDGAVNPVKGILPLVKMAREEGHAECVVPFKNRAEGEAIPGIRILGVSSLSELLQYLKGEKIREEGTARSDAFQASVSGTEISVPSVFSAEISSSSAGKPENGPAGRKKAVREETPDFSDINGQCAARRCAEIAAAGFHHLLLVGPPGSGKTMLAKRIPTILPSLTPQESLEVSAVYSVAGLLCDKPSLITERPFLSPHHTITETALSGGGRVPRPGVVSLAHRGVLFLDEMAEFRPGVLELLRQPLEDKEIHIARLGGNYVYPADFILVGALNPCPCGFYPDLNRCRCTPSMIARYKRRISGPILDRMDLCAEVPRVTIKELKGVKNNESSAAIRKRVGEARRIQEERYAGRAFRFNADLPPQDMDRYCKLGTAEQRLMDRIYRSMQLSARAYFRTLRVARTIADLDGSEAIKEFHLAEAVSCRVSGGKYWEEQGEV